MKAYHHITQSINVLLFTEDNMKGKRDENKHTDYDTVSNGNHKGMDRPASRGRPLTISTQPIDPIATREQEVSSLTL